MITFPIAKINLGLNVVEKRADGYHNLQTVFFPVPLLDALDVQEMGAEFPSQYDCDLKVSNIHIDGDEQRNLVVFLICLACTRTCIKVSPRRLVWVADRAIAAL